MARADAGALPMDAAEELPDDASALSTDVVALLDGVRFSPTVVPVD